MSDDRRGPPPKKTVECPTCEGRGQRTTPSGIILSCPTCPDGRGRVDAYDPK